MNYNLITKWGGTTSRLPKGGQRLEVKPHRLSDSLGGDS